MADKSDDQGQLDNDQSGQQDEVASNSQLNRAFDLNNNLRNRQVDSNNNRRTSNQLINRLSSQISDQNSQNLENTINRQRSHPARPNTNLINQVSDHRSRNYLPDNQVGSLNDHYMAQVKNHLRDEFLNGKIDQATFKRIAMILTGEDFERQPSDYRLINSLFNQTDNRSTSVNNQSMNATSSKNISKTVTITPVLMNKQNKSTQPSILAKSSRLPNLLNRSQLSNPSSINRISNPSVSNRTSNLSSINRISNPPNSSRLSNPSNKIQLSKPLNNSLLLKPSTSNLSSNSKNTNDSTSIQPSTKSTIPTPILGRFGCKICNRVFRYKHVLDNHSRIHTGEKPFACYFCSKKFNRDHHLKAHMRLHTGEKPYACSICDKNFVQVANLRRHLRTHSGERPYVCGYPNCESAFIDSNQLKSHLLMHRKKESYQCNQCGNFYSGDSLLQHKCSNDKGEPSKLSKQLPSELSNQQLNQPLDNTILTVNTPLAGVYLGNNMSNLSNNSSSNSLNFNGSNLMVVNSGSFVQSPILIQSPNQLNRSTSNNFQMLNQSSSLLSGSNSSNLVQQFSALFPNQAFNVNAFPSLQYSTPVSNLNSSPILMSNVPSLITNNCNRAAVLQQFGGINTSLIGYQQTPNYFFTTTNSTSDALNNPNVVYQQCKQTTPVIISSTSEDSRIEENCLPPNNKNSNKRPIEQSNEQQLFEKPNNQSNDESGKQPSNQFSDQSINQLQSDEQPVKNSNISCILSSVKRVDRFGNRFVLKPDIKDPPSQKSQFKNLGLLNQDNPLFWEEQFFFNPKKEDSMMFDEDKLIELNKSLNKNLKIDVRKDKVRKVIHDNTGDETLIDCDLLNANRDELSKPLENQSGKDGDLLNEISDSSIERLEIHFQSDDDDDLMNAESEELSKRLEESNDDDLLND